MKKIIKFCICLILIVCGILLYSRYIGTRGLNVKEYKISYSNLSSDFYGLKIIHFSDIHYGKTIGQKELENIVNKINLSKPDIIVFTGDLIDDDSLEEEVVSILSKLEVSIGKYAIKGEDDSNIYEEVMEKSGFKVLNGEYETIYTSSTDYILLAGLNTNNNVVEQINSFNEFINTCEKKPNYSILLMHKPDSIDEIDYSLFNLVLAGHSHNGQIRLPIIGGLKKESGSKKYLDSYYKLNNTDFYISGGLGVSDIDYRLFNHPSYNLYRLTN